MYSVIFKHEMSYWKRNPLPYIFGIFLFSISFLSMWGMASDQTSGPNIVFQNSSYRLNYISGILTQLMIFILPAIIGTSIYRDYKSRIYTLLYSYPFQKSEYLLAKFTSSFLILTTVVSMIILGLFLGSLMPGVNPDAVIPNNYSAYFHLYFLFIIPNMFLISVIVFGVVAFTRNVYIGFIVSIMILVVNGVVGSLLGGLENEFLHSLMDPLGINAVENTVQHWTLSDKNNNPLPITGPILWNRLFWISVAGIIGRYCYAKFDFNQFASSIFSKNKSAIESTDSKSMKLEKIKLPTITYNYQWITRIKTIWNLSNVDLKLIVFSWPFIVILLGGFLMVSFQQAEMAPQHGVPMLPTTSDMLRFPMFIFSGVFNLLTFLYTGMLLYRAINTRMDTLVDSSPFPNWAFMLTKLVAILKMQFILLTLILLAGIISQTIQGYYKYEITHYLFELFIIQFLHFSIWACTAIFVHSLFKNMYLSFFVLILIPIGIIMMPGASDILHLPFLQESVLHFNMVPDLFLGFDYSVFNGYGSVLPVYFTYKFYWLLGAILLLLLSLLMWKRGLTFSIKERLAVLLSRLKNPLKIALFTSVVCFIGMGVNIYYQEHFVSKTFYTDEDEDKVFALNEINYGRYVNMPQPKIATADLKMDIYPKSRDYELSGKLSFVNKMSVPIDTILVGTSFKDDVSIALLNESSIIKDDKELRYIMFKLKEPLLLGDSLRMRINVKNHPNSFLHDNSRALSNGTFISSNIIPTLGGRNLFLSNQKKRDKFKLGKRKTLEYLPSDSTFLGYEFSGNSMDRILYECIITTSEDQTGLTMGDLIDSGTKDGRNYFHYKSNGSISNTMSWVSATLEKRESSEEGIKVNIFHHPDHTENIDNLRRGVEASIAYCTKWFGPLHHKSINLVEFALPLGTYATINGNLMPISESKWLCDINSDKNEDFNHPFFVAAHEVAHYWWGHRVDPASVQGSKMVSESMAEFIAHMSVEKTFGKEKMRKQRSKYMNDYFTLRAEYGKEKPLATALQNQDYINYVKGDIVMTALSKYVGEENLNEAFARYEKAKRYTAPPYPTSLDFIDNIRTVVPDSLNYLIKDLFETITVYDSKIVEAKVHESDKNLFSVNVDLIYSKYRSDKNGNKLYNEGDRSMLKDGETKSLPLNDFLKIGFYSSDGQEEIRIINISQIRKNYTFAIDFKPHKIVLDPEVLLIDGNRDDNSWDLF